MKKIAASIGVVAVGATALHAAYAPGLSDMETSKAWSVSATLRGFYDDNIYSTPTDEVDSFGFEISPSIGLNLSGDQTLIGLGYTYSGKWYDEARYGFDHWSSQHLFDAALQHAFSPRLSLTMRDSFAMGDEPDFLRAGDAATTFQRLVSNENIRNYGKLAVNYQVTRLMGLEAGYGNQFWDYDDEGFSTTTILGTTFVSGASQSGTLDRLEHDPYVDTRWMIAPQTTGILGYRYHQTGYTGDEYILGIISPANLANAVSSSDRDYRSHYVYAGAEHGFRPDLTAWINAGIRYTDYFESADDQTDTAPYVKLGVNYQQSQDSNLGLNYSYDFNSTDLVGNTATDPVRGQDSHVVSGWFRHQITPSLIATLQGTFQCSTFQGGGPQYDGETEFSYQAGINFEYRFNRHFSAHLGYSYDQLDSDVPGRQGGFERNRFYAGVTATY